MKASKRFRWEGAHRLPWHTGGCENLHGHSYEMWVEFEGEPDERGMLIDFKEIKSVIKPLVDAWDHATLVAEYDADLMRSVELLNSKHFVLPYDSTSENICRYTADYLCESAFSVLFEHRIRTIRVRVKETETCYGELEVPVAAYATNGAAAEATAVSS